MYDKVAVRTGMKWGCTDGQTEGRCDFNIPPFWGIKISMTTNIINDF
jgi:hypothetical protein